MPQTILVLLYGDLGDTLLTVPALRAVRARFDDARLLVMAKAASGKYVFDLGLVDEVIDVDKHALDRMRSLANPRTTARLVALVRRLRRQQIDILIIFQHLSTRWGLLKYWLLSLVSGAPVRAGLDNGRGKFLTHRVSDLGFGAAHESQYWLQVAASLGAHGNATLEAAVSHEDRLAASKLLESAAPGTGPILAIHPGVGWYAPGRQWGAPRFAEAAALVMERLPVQCLIVGSEGDRPAATEVLTMLHSRASGLVGRTSAGQLAAVLERCDLVLANDGGVAHLAAAVGTPTITIFGPSNDAAWRPLSGEVIATDLPCRPCLYRDFEIGLRDGCATRECLSQISPGMVADRIVARLRNTSLAV